MSDQKEPKKVILSIIIPTLNEESGIGSTIDSIPKKELSSIGEFEIVVIDGNSKDKTVEIAKSKGARVIIEPVRGYGRAYKTGFNEAIGEYVVTIDGDGTYPTEQIPSLLRQIVEKDYCFMTTNRFAHLGKNSMTLMNKFGNRVLSITSNVLHGSPFFDSQSGMWLLKRSAWLTMSKFVLSNGMEFSQEIKIEAVKNFGLKKCVEVPIFYGARLGRPKLNPIGDGLKNFKHLFVKKFSN